jgi:hypothetical protein
MVKKRLMRPHTRTKWVIRSQAPKLVMIEHGEGSETKWLRLVYEGLINLIRDKI